MCRKVACAMELRDASTGACVLDSALGTGRSTSLHLLFRPFPRLSLGESSSSSWSKLGMGGRAISVACVWVVAGGSWARGMGLLLIEDEEA
jgi:hypothetical protein